MANTTSKRITVIPASINILAKSAEHSLKKRRVAGYARVSTDSDEQYTSYEAQVDFYTKFIKERADWSFVRVYTDEGISGTNTRRREGFNEMIADALDGKIDLIVTKSVSRFARNTVDSLVTIRKLKEKGVEVFFQKENIWTMDSKGELLITIMSSLAQEESRSISENVTWGQRKRFADGKVSLPYGRFLGYAKGADGLPQVVEEEAEVVRYIYRLFIRGKTPHGIAKILTAEGIQTPAGQKKWHGTTVQSILMNEKYKGSALLQKTFTVDFLQKKLKINEGEVPQYYVENSHDAIIDPREWDAVQTELARRQKLGGRYRGTSIMASRMVCADCGSFFGEKVWHSNSRYQKTILRCNSKYKGEQVCSTPTLSEVDVKKRFLTLYNTLLLQKEVLLDDCESIRDTLTDCSAIEKRMNTLQQEMEVVAELIQRCVEENSTIAMDQDEYAERYNGYVDQYEKAKEAYTDLARQKEAKLVKRNAMDTFITSLSERAEPIVEFDDLLWVILVEQVIVHHDGRLTFCFHSGMEFEG